LEHEIPYLFTLRDEFLAIKLFDYIYNYQLFL
jgi:hypothetical protein